MRYIYADNGATTRMSDTAVQAMLPFLQGTYGNPSSLHSVGQAAAEALVKARETVARCLHADPKEITFTSGGSEADNQAIVSAARLGARKGKRHMRVSAFLRMHPEGLLVLICRQCRRMNCRNKCQRCCLRRKHLRLRVRRW